MNDVLAIILGGGRGQRLFPLTERRSKPAVPIGGKYRLIDIPISSCLHSDIRRIFVLTQFNSASLNHHIGMSYRMDVFSRGFVEILAAEQTPESSNWFQGTADAVRQARRHFEHHEADYYLILAGDHLYRMDYTRMLDAHIDRDADITIAAQPVDEGDATQMGIFHFDRSGQIVAFEEKPKPARLAEIGPSVPTGSVFTTHKPEKPYVASMGIYVFSRQVLLDMLQEPGIDFGREIIPAAISRYKVQAHLHRDYWADVGTVDAYYYANIALTLPEPPFEFYDSRRPIYTRPRFLPASRLDSCSLREALISEGCYIEKATIEGSVVGLRNVIAPGARITRSLLLGADYYEAEDMAPRGEGSAPPIGFGRDVVLDRVIVDKNARIGHGVRLVNEAGVQEADGDGYYIRNGIIIVPKEGVVREGTVV
jgi:glucose-1-phosphate adenylyltransferase